jgi:hypothetical protein
MFVINENELGSMSEAVRVVFDQYPKGHEFYGSELKRDVVKIYPKAKFMYPDSLLRKMRYWRHGRYKCLNIMKSLYRKVAK